MKIEERGGRLVITDFNEVEAYKVACALERKGIEFYKQIIDKADKKIATELAFLLEEEKRHLALFEKLLAKAKGSLGDGFEEDGLIEYLETGIFHPFDKMPDFATRIHAAVEALNLGIKIEKNTLQFYNACLAQVKDESGQKAIAEIISQEEQHKKLLEEVYRLIKGG